MIMEFSNHKVSLKGKRVFLVSVVTRCIFPSKVCKKPSITYMQYVLIGNSDEILGFVKKGMVDPIKLKRNIDLKLFFRSARSISLVRGSEIRNTSVLKTDHIFLGSDLVVCLIRFMLVNMFW